ncbi:hypothetical protein PTTG_30027 [Puccinia triticina 1-1 BBBD Race 1]|uniref:Uncharacterized protein n=1 Tax=Puccinia triticina (isolate 1-1 / race 1 (BBBD)) TaxID=630390 RepID=A0A180G2Z5_PUCT1|nr:hypothetical protein PTTG_30027 [Puccinia triticina 1-1 BBBD Race 1]
MAPESRKVYWKRSSSRNQTFDMFERFLDHSETTRKPSSVGERFYEVSKSFRQPKRVIVTPDRQSLNRLCRHRPRPSTHHHHSHLPHPTSTTSAARFPKCPWNTNPDIEELDMESLDVKGVTSPPAGHLLPADWSLRAIYVRHKLYARVQYAADSHRPAKEAPTYRMVDTDSYLAPFQLGVSQLTQFDFASFKRRVMRQSMQQAGASMPHPIDIVSVYADFMDILTWKYAVNQSAKVPMKVLDSNRFSTFQAELLEAPPKTRVWISLEMDTKAISLQSNAVLTLICNRGRGLPGLAIRTDQPAKCHEDTKDTRPTNRRRISAPPAPAAPAVAAVAAVPADEYMYSWPPHTYESCASPAPTVPGVSVAAAPALPAASTAPAVAAVPADDDMFSWPPHTYGSRASPAPTVPAVFAAAPAIPAASTAPAVAAVPADDDLFSWPAPYLRVPRVSSTDRPCCVCRPSTPSRVYPPPIPAAAATPAVPATQALPALDATPGASTGQATPAVPAVTAASDITIEMFLTICQLPPKDPKVLAIINKHRIYHWTAFEDVSLQNLLDLGFLWGPARQIMNGSRLARELVADPDDSVTPPPISYF